MFIDWFYGLGSLLTLFLFNSQNITFLVVLVVIVILYMRKPKLRNVEKLVKCHKFINRQIRLTFTLHWLKPPLRSFFQSRFTWLLTQKCKPCPELSFLLSYLSITVCVCVCVCVRTGLGLCVGPWLTSCLCSRGSADESCALLCVTCMKPN